ncbi:MAG: PQQ-binding-like beta-propeller repeat protein [Pseudomonadota bacterium]
MTTRRFPTAAPVAFLLAGAMVLSACQERSTILPGKREPVRSVLQGAEALPLVEAENISAPISLPAPVANSNWTHGIGSPSYRTAHPALSASPQLAWSVNIGKGDSRKQRITADPVVTGGLIFTLDADSLVTAVSTSGAIAWQRTLRPARDAEGDATGGGLATDGETLFVSLGYGELAALDVATGAVRWTQQLDATGSGRPTVFGNLVYLMVGDNAGWALDKSSGRIAWQVGTGGDITNVLGAPAPALTDDLAIFAFGSGELQAVFRRGGLSRWNAAVLGERPGRALSKIDDVTGAPVVDGTRVYAGNQAGRMIAVDTGSGKRIWTANDGAIGTMYPIGGSVFALTDANELVRLDADDGTRIWGIRLPNFVKDRPRRIAEVFAHHGPVVAGGLVRVASSDAQLRSVNPQDGSLAAITEIPGGGATTAPVIAGRTLYVVNRNGQLLAYR